MCYLAGGQSGSTMDVSVKVEGGFGYTAAAETQTCSGSDLGAVPPTADFSLLTTRAQT